MPEIGVNPMGLDGIEIVELSAPKKGGAGTII